MLGVWAHNVTDALTGGVNQFPRIASRQWKYVEHISETSWKIEANISYWNPTLIPSFKYVEETQIPKMATLVVMFKNSEIDIPIGITTDMRIELENQGHKH